MTADDDIFLMIDRNSPYLSWTDLLGQEATVTIVSVSGGTVEDPKSRKKTRKAIVTLKGWEKPLAVNITNAKVIFSITGTSKAKALVGHRITIYPDMTIKNPRTGEMGAIRVRPTKPTGAGIPQSALLGKKTETVPPREAGEEG
jgi:hypothetical protein